MEYLLNKALKKLLVKWVPLSLMIAQGMLNLVKIFSVRNFIDTLASLVLIGMMSSHSKT